MSGFWKGAVAIAALAILTVAAIWMREAPTGEEGGGVARLGSDTRPVAAGAQHSPEQLTADASRPQPQSPDDSPASAASAASKAEAAAPPAAIREAAPRLAPSSAARPVTTLPGLLAPGRSPRVGDTATSAAAPASAGESDPASTSQAVPKANASQAKAIEPSRPAAGGGLAPTTPPRPVDSPGESPSPMLRKRGRLVSVDGRSLVLEPSGSTSPTPALRFAITPETSLGKVTPGDDVTVTYTAIDNQRIVMRVLPARPMATTTTSANTISVGQTKDEVVAILGKPRTVLKFGAKEMYVFKDLKVTFVGGKLTDVE